MCDIEENVGEQSGKFSNLFSELINKVKFPPDENKKVRIVSYEDVLNEIGIIKK